MQTRDSVHRSSGGKSRRKFVLSTPRSFFSNCQENKLNCCCTETLFPKSSRSTFRFINFLKKKVASSYTVNLSERKRHFPRGALLEIGNFDPRNSMGLCVEMTAGSARLGRPHHVVWGQRDGARGNPGHPLPRRLGCIYRPTDGEAECARPLTRAHMRKRERKRERGLLNPHPCCRGIKFDGPTDIGEGVDLVVAGDRLSIIPSAVTDNALAREI